MGSSSYNTGNQSILQKRTSSQASLNMPLGIGSQTTVHKFPLASGCASRRNKRLLYSNGEGQEIHQNRPGPLEVGIVFDQDHSKSLPNAISTHKAESSIASAEYELMLHDMLSSEPSGGPQRPLQQLGNLPQESSKHKESSRVQSTSMRSRPDTISTGFSGVAKSIFTTKASPVKLTLAQQNTPTFQLKRKSSGVRRGLGSSGLTFKAKKPKL